MIGHLICAALVLVAVAILDTRAARRSAAMLGALTTLRSDLLGEPEADDGDDGPEGGALVSVTFDGPEGEPDVTVPVALDAADLARVDAAVDAVREAGDRPSGAFPAYRPRSTPPDDGLPITPPDDDAPA